ncbi:ketoacyl-ACP synthase III [Maribacter sp. PR1]|uniref:Ketoacyl-ACP synthase III n=1 Tax=Maribacter cobaltidurans TaxID=1178778 RepID=A0ABU7INV5_9FLAO|nr:MULTISPECIES: ketoacyl-ACP synthase III [Maribacter]MDC6387257.1 ketoacyl-ACP synthase III [Maribacter sp. PR1]MEE1974642.1 ketoacyl-ACP synthase III [Maribacter cobaltidurans]
MNVSITGTGSFIPENRVRNESFLNQKFLNSDGSKFQQTNEIIIEKFKGITGIKERRYVKEDLNTSDIAFIASERAILDAGIDKENIDYIIFAHNFGDVPAGKSQGDTLPSLAARVKHLLKIKNPKCVAYDMLFGCPGWIEGVIQANAFIKSGIAKTCLIIGAETLSRIVDPYDRDSMIYADGAGAVILEESNNTHGIISHNSASFTYKEAYYLFYGKSYNKSEQEIKYIKMLGRKIYEFAVTHVPSAMAECLKESCFDIREVKKILIHQANEKMDEAIVSRFYALFNREVPKDIMPMTIDKLGNSSVATIPTLLDQILKGKVENHHLHTGDVIIFASVGAGMNVNAIVYKI